MPTAWTLPAFGLDNLTRAELTSAALGPHDARLRVRAISLNYRDLMVLRGDYDPRLALPAVLCSDAVAEVLEVGDAVTDLQPGERVIPAFAPGWLSGPPTRAGIRGALGASLGGTLREELVLPAASLVRAPAHLSDEEAATLPCAGVTAWRALVTEGRLQPGQVLVTQGTGGVSLFAAQLGVMLGARVLLTSRSADKLARVASIGAHHCIDTSEIPDWAKQVLALTERRGADLIVELGGADTLDASLRCVAVGGTIAIIGVLSGVAAPVTLTRVLMNHVRLQGIFVGAKQDLVDLCAALVAHPTLRPIVDRSFSYAEAPAAFRYLERQHHVGKVVIRVP